MFVPEAGAALEHVDDGANHPHRNPMSVVNNTISRHRTGDDAIRSQQLVTGRIRFAASGQARSVRAAVVVE